MTVTVIDENGVAVPGAQLRLSGPRLLQPIIRISDAAGRFSLPDMVTGAYTVKVEKVGYYAFISDAFQIRSGASQVEVVLNHRQEFEETVNVVYSAPIIDRQEAAAQTTMTSEEIIDLPFPSTHDFRQALSLMPGTVKDNSGRIHINGGDVNQAAYSLDGFNVTSPVSGALENRISVDAIRNIRVETSRISTEYGKGSAGVVALETSRGDDRSRFSATNFLPSYEFHDGLNISNWTPRATISGPIVKGHAWYFNAMDLQYDLNIVDALPSSANTNRNWHGSNLMRLQARITQRNLLSVAFLGNFQSSRNWGLGPLDPIATSRNRCERFYFASLKNQAYLRGGWVLETGVAVNRLRRSDQPQGEQTYRISPTGRSGNYFESSKGHEERVQLLTNLLAPPQNLHGRHLFKFGIDGNRIRYYRFVSRHSFEVYRFEQTLSRLVEFSGNPEFEMSNSEFSAYGQDRWSPNDRILVEGGLRLDWDQVQRKYLTSPRVAVTWGPTRLPDTKLSFGIGAFYDAVNLDLMTRPQGQQRTDTFFNPDGAPVADVPIRITYSVPARMKAPLYVNWSLGWEQKLPLSFSLKTNYIRRTGHNGWSYEYQPHPGEQGARQGLYILQSQRQDSYDYWELNLSRTFKDKFPWLMSYARSSARSSAVIDYSPDNPLFGRQGGGPLEWDAPNRLISWAFLPVPFKPKYTIAYSLEWRSGFPFSIVDDVQRLVGPPNSRRFPDYFSLNLHCERRFHFWRYQWALRAGFNNMTGHMNPVTVNNNTGSPDFGRFSGGHHRTFNGRIRFLGKS